MARTAKGKRLPFSLYLYEGDDLEGEVADLLVNNNRRQALMREYVLLGYKCAQQGLKLDVTQQHVEGMQPDQSHERLPGAIVSGAGMKDGDQAITSAENVNAEGRPSLRGKYGNLT